MGSVFLWAVILAFMILGMSTPQLLQSGLLSISAVPPDSYLPTASLPVLLFPCPDLCCWPKLAWYVLGDPSALQRLVWVSLSTLVTPPVLLGLCALVLVSEVRPLCHGACVHLSWLPRCGFCMAGLACTCFSSPCLPSASQGLYALVSSHCLHSL